MYCRVVPLSSAGLWWHAQQNFKLCGEIFSCKMLLGNHRWAFFLGFYAHRLIHLTFCQRTKCFLTCCSSFALMIQLFFLPIQALAVLPRWHNIIYRENSDFYSTTTDSKNNLFFTTLSLVGIWTANTVCITLHFSSCGVSSIKPSSARFNANTIIYFAQCETTSWLQYKREHCQGQEVHVA